MLEKIRSFDLGFTDRKKRFFALGAIVFAVVWAILWVIFPMQWYSLFFASTIGSYVQLILLATVLIFILCWVFTKITASNISVTKNYFVNLIFMIGILFLFSAFRYSMVYLIVIAAVLHAAAMVWVLGTAIPNNEISASAKCGFLKLKEQPLITVMWAVLYTIIINAANIFLFWKIAYIFYS